MSTSKYKQRLAKERKAAAIQAAQQAAERRRRLTIIGAVLGTILLVAVIAAVVVVSHDDSPSVSADASGATTTTSGSGFTYGTAACAPADGPPVPPQLDFPDTNGFEQCIDPSANYVATINTTAGQVKVQLDAANQPGTVNNFVQLAGYGYYDNTLLFRTDTSIGIIQGGAPHTNSASDPGPGFTIDDEGKGLTYKPGQLVMARTPNPNSAGSQFFFTVTDAGTQSLGATGTYVVFGEVISGLDVLQQILSTNVEGTDGLGGSPNPPITVTSIVIGEARLVDGSSTTSTPTANTPDTATTVPASSATSSSTIDPSVSTPKATSSTSIPA